MRPTSGKILFSLVLIFLLFFVGGELYSKTVSGGEDQEYEIKKAKIYRDTYPVISESDLYCSFFVLEERKIPIKIISAKREYEKTFLSDGDIIGINQGKKDGLEEEQIFLILEIGPKIKGFGFLAFKRGRARIVNLEDRQASARIERACGQVMIGHYLVPFEEKEGLLGKDLGYDVSPQKGEGLTGSLIYLQSDYTQVGSNQWALIDLGEEDGVHVGQQLIIYRKSEKDDSVGIIGNLIIIDTQKKTSTVKILSCKYAVMKGDRVQTRLQ